MKYSENQYRELEGLYVTVLVRHKYNEHKNFTARCKMHAEILDRLNVPWKIQNSVAAAAEKRENWSRYNKDVLSDILA